MKKNSTDISAAFCISDPPMCNCALTAHRQTISHERGGSLAIFHRNPKLRGADVLLFQIPLELSSPQMYTFLFLLKCFIFRLILQGWPRVLQGSARFYHTIPYGTISQSVLQTTFFHQKSSKKYFYKVKFNCVQVEIESLFFFFTVPFSFALLCFVIRRPILSIRHVQC